MTANIAQYVSFVASGQVGFPPGQALTRTVTFPGAVAAGDTILVWTDDSNGGGTGGAQTITDNINSGSYSLLKQVDDTSGAGQQSFYLYAMFNSLPATAGSMTIQVVFPVLIWQGIFAMDVTGVTTAPFINVAGAVQTAVGTGANAISTGNVAGGAGSAIVIAGVSNTSAQAVTGSGPPSAGTSPAYTLYIQDGNWNTSGTPGAGPEGTPDANTVTFEYLTSNAPGTIPATFTAFSGDSGDNFASIVVVLQSSGSFGTSIAWIV